MAYRCVGHADYDPVLPAELTYTEAGIYLIYPYFCRSLGRNLPRYDPASIIITLPLFNPDFFHFFSSLAVSRFIDVDKDGIITNWEFYLALDPNNMEGNDYVFDHYEWPHCDEQSIIMK